MSSLREPGARRRSFAASLMAAQALVLLADAATTWLVATVVAPGIFHEHLQRAGVTQTAEETQHVERAFSSALLISSPSRCSSRWLLRWRSRGTSAAGRGPRYRR